VNTHTLRYVRDVPLKFRLHAPTVTKFVEWVDAEDHRLAQPNAADLEVVQRFGYGDGRGL
jgi:hypothetical protein